MDKRSFSFFRKNRNFPKQDAGTGRHTILVLFIISLLFFLLVRFIPFRKGDALTEDMFQASEIMEEAMAALRECQREGGLHLDTENDPNQTGLIGFESSPLTTTIGNLEAKRTTTNPNFAALVVYLLQEAGVERGDTVAVGASSSFPALIVAVLSAAKAMDLHPLMINSLGASQWGANLMDFHWLDMLNCLLKSGIFDFQPIALSLGGEKDKGEDMSSEGRTFLREEIDKSGFPFIDDSDLRVNVKARMRLYEKNAGANKIKAFINIGGSWANMGTDAEVLELKPGLVRIRQLPSLENRGVIFEMASRKIPVIHLLFVRGLVERYGLSWDPVPLPSPGKERLFQRAREKQPLFLWLSVIYLSLVVFIFVFRNKLR
ncbi:MAG: poly-gamma-glutamate system protein [Candidatus Aminicenantes bacterium]|jgi:poly-gamma-glutamate system protein